MAGKKRVTAKDLNIKVDSKRERDLFDWLMCVILFSKPVQQELAGEAFKVLRKNKVDSPNGLKKAGWQKIVNLLGEAHYVRYDESTATRLLEAGEKVQEEYDGRLKNLVDNCDSAAALKKRIQEFKGVGPKGAEIFMGEVGPVYFN
ncbi:MAG: DNA methylase [Pseudohongiellaceae bacterium]